MEKGIIRLIVDPQYGDSGKGKIGTIYSYIDKATQCVEYGTGHSAGHQLNLTDGESYLTSAIPPVYVNRNCRLVLDKRMCVNEKLFFSELETLKKFNVKDRIFIDSRCIKLNGDEREKGYIGEYKTVADTPTFSPFLADSDKMIQECIDRGENQVVVVQHGKLLTKGYGEGEVIPYPLSLNEAIDRFDKWKERLRIVYVLKMMPTRTYDGPLENEIEWPTNIPRAYGLHTKRPHRIAERISDDVLADIKSFNKNAEIALTFADYFDPEIKDKKDGLTVKLLREVHRIEEATGIPVNCISTGKLLTDFTVGKKYKSKDTKYRGEV